jgi:hypothetical protein
VSYLSHSAADNQGENAPPVSVLSLLLSKNPTNPNLIYLSKNQVFSSPISHCVFTAFVFIPSYQNVKFCVVLRSFPFCLKSDAKSTLFFNGGSRPAADNQ